MENASILNLPNIDNFSLKQQASNIKASISTLLQGEGLKEKRNELNHFLYFLGTLYSFLGNWKKSNSFFDKIEDFGGPELRRHIQYKKGRNFAKLNKNEKALRIFEHQLCEEENRKNEAN